MKDTFCRLYGSYEALNRGKITEALIDFTSGIDEFIELNRQTNSPNFKENIKCLLQQVSEKKLLLGCSIFSDEDSDAKHSTTGLVTGKIILISLFQIIIFRKKKRTIDNDYAFFCLKQDMHIP